MIIILSKDFNLLAHALQELYDEPGVTCFESRDWLQNLSHENDDKFVSRLTLIGHSDSFYGEDQSFFGGNLNEKVMLIDEFAHSLINLLKYNERQKPGFCKHLKHIDIIDCHTGEQKFLAPLIARYLQEDEYLREYAEHTIISSFANAQHPKSGTVLKPHSQQNDTLSFYTFNSPTAFKKYQTLHQQLTEKQTELHHLRQMPGHSVVSSSGQNRNEAIIHLEKQCETLHKKEKQLLKEETHQALSISDPRAFLDKNKACQISVGHVKSALHAPQKSSALSPRLFTAKHTNYLDGNTLHTPKHRIVAEEEHRHHKKFQ